MTLLEFHKVTKRFRDGLREVAVLDDVSFELFGGETVGVFGSRGTGKTTLLRIMAGLDTPDQGEIHWRGRSVARLNADERARNRRRSGIGLACGDWRAGSSKVVIEHVAMPLYSEGLGTVRAETVAWRALRVMEASEHGNVSTGTLSLAERVRVELARAIVREPALLLVDEPAVLPQPGDARDLLALIYSLPKQLDLSLVVASEDISALRGAERVMHLDNGHLYTTDSRRKVIELAERRRGGSTGAGAS
jgi:ABC-type methionine transport system ATPase subunit